MAIGVGGTNYSWRALEPYPIESELAKTAMGSPQGSVSAVSAGAMLQGYQADRALQQTYYGDDVMRQQQFQRDELAAQMADNNMKALNEAGKSGTLGLFGPQYANLPGADPNAWQTVIGQLEQNRQAGNLKNIGQGAQGLAYGGYGLPVGAVSQLSGIPGVTPQMPVLEGAAAIRGQYGLAAAQAKGASSGIPGSSVTLPPDNTLSGVEEHYTKPKGMSDDAWQTFISSKLKAQGRTGGSAPGSSGATSQPPPPLTGGTGATNLPMAKTDTPANAPPPQTGSPPDANTSRQIQTAIAGRQNLPPAVAQALRNPTVAKQADGSSIVYGSDGKPYMRLPKGQ